MTKRIMIDLSLLLWGILIFFNVLLLMSTKVMAFTKLINGFQTMTSTYLTPLSGAVAGFSFLLYVILSYFKQEEYQKKIGNVLALSVLATAGLELINSIIQSFS